MEICSKNVKTLKKQIVKQNIRTSDSNGKSPQAEVQQW